MDTLLNKLWPEDLRILSAEQQNALQKKLLPDFQQLLEQEAITANTEILSRLKEFYLPFSAWLAVKHTNQPLVIGINGAQGSGKSTLVKILATLLEKGFAKRVVTLSIDDLYMSRRQRQHLAETIHPLFITRGVPGTHNIEMGLQLIADLKNTESIHEILIPGFNKATDAPYEQAEWKKICTPVDIILFEGWCVGAIAENEKALIPPINSLEANEDPDMRWRNYVNQQLGGSYQQLFSLIDQLIMLEIPDIQQIYQWRSLQEHKLATASIPSHKETSEETQHIMSEAQLHRFMLHFERITRATLKEMPSRADIVLKLNKNHQVTKVVTPK